MAINDPNLNITITGEDKFSPVVQRFESGLIRAVGAISSAIATLSTLAFPVTQAANLEREMANVAKTTGFTVNQIAVLTRELAQMSLVTDTSAVDLAKIAAAAGQQGLGREGVDGIRQFTESVARMASVLDLTAEDAGRSIGKIANIFNIPLREIENTVSAINQLSNNSTARANELINVLKRLGDAGGSLKFTQALALSATALDLGASPEVAGTTLAKFQSALKVRNEEFAKLLGRSRETVARQASEDGFTLFTEVLQELNKVTLVDREKMITKLFGGGRINALADKQLQDVLKNSPILLRNLNQAERGQESGTSAIKEQQTVLQTFNKQVEILINSFKELGRAAGEDLLIPLTGYVSQLRGALQNDGVKSFVEAVVRAFGQLTGVLVSAAKFVGDLNVNWTNFITVFKVFAIVKMIEAVRTLIGLMPGLNASIALLTGTSATAATADTAARTAQIGAWGALKAAIAQATTAINVYSDARTRAATLDADLLAKERAAADALARERLLRRDAEAKSLQAKTAKNNVTIAQSSLAQTTANGDKAILGVNAAGQQAIANARAIGHQKLEAAELFHQKRLADITAGFAGSRTVLEKSMRDAILNEENTFYAKQIAGISTQNARRIAQAEKFAAATLGITAARVRAEIEQEERVVAQKKLLAASAASTSDAANVALASAAATTASTARAREAATAASLGNAVQVSQVSKLRIALQGLSAAFALVGQAVGLLLRAITPLFFWLTLVFTVLDAVGVLDKLPGLFNRITDAIGLTTKAARDKELQDKKDHENAVRAKKDLDDLIDRYQKLKDAKTGLLDKTQLEIVEGELKGAKNTQEFQTVVPKVASLIEGNIAERNKNQQDIEELPKKLEEVNRQIEEKTKRLETLKANFSVVASSTGEVDVSGSQQAIDEVEADIDALQKRAAALSPTVRRAMAETLSNSQEDAKKIRELIGGIFTDQSADIFQSTAPMVIALRDRLTALNEEREKAVKQSDDQTSAEGRRAGQQAVAQVDEQITAQKALINQALEDVRKQLDSLSRDSSVTDATKRSLAAVIGILALGSETIRTFSNGLLDFKKNSQDLLPNAGGLINPDFGKPPKPGTKSGVADNDNEERRKIKARAEYLKATNAAEAARVRQHLEEMSDINRRSFERGLIDLTTFYSNKEAIDELNLEKDLERTNLDIEQKRAARKSPELKESDRIRIDAEIASLEGQRDVILAKIRDLPRQIGEALDQEMKAFNEGVISDKIDLGKVLGLNDFKGALDLQFALIGSQIKDKIARLQSELAKGTPGITQAFIDNVKLGQLVRTLDPVLQLIANKARTTSDAIGNAIERIELRRDQGKLTDDEAEALTNRARAAEAEVVRRQIEEQEKLQDAFLQKAIIEQRSQGVTDAVTEAAIKQTEAWQTQENAIDSLRLKYEQLSEVIDSTARKINQSIENNLANALEDFANGTERNLFKSITNFGNALARDINATLARSLSQDLIKNFLGGGGTGGIGGVFSRLFKTGSIFPKAGEGGAKPDLLDKDLLGRDAGHAMYVQLVKGQDALANKAEDSLFNKLFGTKDGPLDVSGDVPLPDFDPFGAEGLSADDFSSDIQDRLDDVNAATDDILESASSLFGEGGLSDVVEPGLEEFGSSLGESMESIFSSIGGSIGGWASALSDAISDIFSSMSSGSGGDGFFSSVGGWLSSFFMAHTGGVVGSATMGKMSASPLVFSNAVRYHTGGIAGLQPDEVPTILKKGEEVLTATDPRHRNNGGNGNITAPVTMIIQTPDANSFRRSQDQVAAQTGAAINRSIRRNR